MVCTTHVDVFNSSEEHLPHTEANYDAVVFLGLEDNRPWTFVQDICPLKYFH